MNVINTKITEVPERELYWTRIIFTERDRKSVVYTSCSKEYLEANYKEKTKESLSNWQETVIKKWKALGKVIFDQGIHFDIYAQTNEGEANGLDFLLKKVQAS